MKNADLLSLARRLVVEANDLGECRDFGRAVGYIVRHLAMISKPGTQSKLLNIAHGVRYPE